MLKFYGAAGYKKNLWVRGLADISIVRDTFGNDKLPPFVANSINILLSNAQSAGLQIRYFQPNGAMGFVKYPILGVQAHSGNNTWSDLLLDPNNPLLAAPPAQLRFFQVPHDDLPGFARQYNVVAATAVAPFAPDGALPLPRQRCLCDATNGADGTRLRLRHRCRCRVHKVL